MNHLKIIGLLAMAVAAMMAFAGTASGAKWTSPTGTEYGKGKTFKVTAGATRWTGAFVNVLCDRSFGEGTITASGGSAVEGSISTLHFEVCNFKTTVKKAGTVSTTPIGTGTELAGTLRWSGGEIEIETSLGTCVFTSSGTDIGTFTGGKTASLDVDGAIPRTAGNFLCGSTGTLEASYSVVTPDELWLDS